MGLRAELPNLPPLVLIVGAKGFVMCGYLNLETAEKLGAAAAVVSGVKSVEDALKADARFVTSAAKELGISPGDNIRKILLKLA